jgi:hypothetical protein
VLAAFGLGCAFGVVAMVPSWWRHRRVAKRKTTTLTPAETVVPSQSGDSSLLVTQPPRDGI